MNSIPGMPWAGRTAPIARTEQPFTPTARTVSGSRQANGDKLEISSQGTYLQRVAELPEIREDKVRQVRQQLIDGNYDIDAKLPDAINRLLSDYGL